MLWTQEKDLSVMDLRERFECDGLNEGCYLAKGGRDEGGRKG